MFEKILIPLDGSRTAQCALSAALGLATVFNSEVDLVHVLTESLPDTGSLVDPVMWHMRKAEKETYLSTMAQPFSKHKLHTKRTVLEGSVAERIITYATRKGTDLIILSSHGYSGISSWNVSSVAQKLIARANRSVMLVRAFQQEIEREEEVTPLPLQRLLVPLDGSRRAESILPIVNKLALAHQASVWLVHIISPASLFLPFQEPDEEVNSMEELVAQYKQNVADYLQQVQSQLECGSKTAVLEGDTVVGALNGFAERESIDLTLLCAHGHSNAKQPYGSVATSAVIHGDSSLFIYQDLPPDEIKPTGAEIASDQQTNLNSTRAKPNAQPAFWSH